MCSFHCGCCRGESIQDKTVSQSVTLYGELGHIMFLVFSCVVLCVFFNTIFLNNNVVQLITLCIYHLFCFHNFFFCFCETMLNTLCCLRRNCTFFFSTLIIDIIFVVTANFDHLCHNWIHLLIGNSFVWLTSFSFLPFHSAMPPALSNWKRLLFSYTRKFYAK